MPTPHKFARQLTACLATAAMLVAPLYFHNGLTSGTPEASAQPKRDQARQHYSNGKHYFAKKKYRLAVGEFQTANKLAPSPVLFFNIGLAYDRLGDKAAAKRNYQDYLRGVPNARNKAAVQAKIRRLEGELRAEAATRAEAAARTKAAEAERAKAAELARRKAAEEAARKKAAKVVVPPVNPGVATNPPPTNPGVATKPPAVTPPGPGIVTKPPPAKDPVKPPISTGDPGLDRVANVDIAALRAKRDGPNSKVSVDPTAAGTNTGTKTGATPTAGPLADSKTKKSKPAYKQWWFWVVVGVSAVILVDIMSTNSSSSAASRNTSTGATILRF